MNDPEKLEHVMNNWNNVAPFILEFNETIVDSSKVSTKIYEFYLKGKFSPIEQKKQLINLATDRLYHFNAEEAAKLHASKYDSPVWFYLFDYRGSNSFSDFLTNSNEDLGNLPIRQCKDNAEILLFYTF